MKNKLIHIMDMIDNYIFKHKWHWICNQIAISDWWGNYDCKCKYCIKFK